MKEMLAMSIDMNTGDSKVMYKDEFAVGDKEETIVFLKQVIEALEERK